MTQQTDLQTVLAANLSSRICHDLVSPVGAVANGVDLIRELGPGSLTEEFAMIGQSVERASNLLQFYRLAFGAPGEDAADIARETLVQRASALLASPRIMLSFFGIEGPALRRDEARLACLMFLCARSVTGMSGVLKISLDPSSGYPVVITIDSNGAAEAADNLSILSSRSPAHQVTPRTIEFFLAREYAMAAGVVLSYDMQPGRIVITATRS